MPNRQKTGPRISCLIWDLQLAGCTIFGSWRGTVCLAATLGTWACMQTLCVELPRRWCSPIRPTTSRLGRMHAAVVAMRSWNSRWPQAKCRPVSIRDFLNVYWKQLLALHRRSHCLHLYRLASSPAAVGGCRSILFVAEEHLHLGQIEWRARQLLP